MVNELVTARQMLCKGIILKILKAEKTVAGRHPAAPVDLLVIKAILAEFGIHKSWEHMQDQVDWLEERGYVRKMQKEMLGISAILVELTDRGMALFNGTLTDNKVLLD